MSEAMNYKIVIRGRKFVRVDDAHGEIKADDGAFISEDGKTLTIGGWLARLRRIKNSNNDRLIVKFRYGCSAFDVENQEVTYRRPNYAHSYELRAADAVLFLMNKGRPSTSFQVDDLRRTLLEEFGIPESDYLSPNDTCNIPWDTSNFAGSRTISWVLTDGNCVINAPDGFEVKTPDDSRLDEVADALTAVVRDASWVVVVSICWDTENDRLAHNAIIHLGDIRSGNDIAKRLDEYLSARGYDNVYDVLDGRLEKFDLI